MGTGACVPGFEWVGPCHGAGALHGVERSRGGLFTFSRPNDAALPGHDDSPRRDDDSPPANDDSSRRDDDPPRANNDSSPHDDYSSRAADDSPNHDDGPSPHDDDPPDDTYDNDHDESSHDHHINNSWRYHHDNHASGDDYNQAGTEAQASFQDWYCHVVFMAPRSVRHLVST